MILNLQSVRFEENIETLVANLKDDESIGAVIIDWDLNLNYMALQKSLIYLMGRPDVLFITGASDKKLPFTTKFNLIGKFFVLNDNVEKLPESIPDFKLSVSEMPLSGNA